MKLVLVILLGCWASSAIAQLSVPDKGKFTTHLVNQEYFDEAIHYIESELELKPHLALRDSFNYLKGWSHYSLKELGRSANSFLQVSSNSPFFYKSRFFAAYNNSHLGLAKSSDYILKNLVGGEKYNALLHFELAGNALLKRDLNQFDNYFSSLQGNTGFAFAQEKQKLWNYATEIKNHKKKSPVVAGLFSAIIPGSGKIYAGKTGEGIVSFIIVGAAGFTVLENYNKLGLKHAKTIVFGTLFSVLYIGNIYGSVFTVKLVNEEFNHEMDHKILFNMHIPLRNIFN